MRVVLMVLGDGRATVNATTDEGKGDYWRLAKPDEIIEGRPVRDYEPGVHILAKLPTDPERG
jgi:hypothetical protein